MYGSYSLSKSWVFRIILITSIVFLLQILQPFGLSFEFLVVKFGLIPAAVVINGSVWQLFTYMFLHGDPMHLLFNMYGIFIFGVMVEEVWGPKKFLLYYLYCGLGAGISIFLLNFIAGGPGYFSPTIGASGAMFGLLLAFGMLFPDVELLVFFVLPVKAKYLVIIYGGIELFMELSGGVSTISHIGHLGGLLFGFLFFIFFEKGRWFKRKVREIARKVERPAGEGQTLRIMPKKDSDLEKKREIIRKLEEHGSLDALTDDEHQFVKYLDIMTDSETLKSVHAIDVTDEHISDRKFMEIIRQYQNK